MRTLASYRIINPARRGVIPLPEFGRLANRYFRGGPEK